MTESPGPQRVVPLSKGVAMPVADAKSASATEVVPDGQQGEGAMPSSTTTVDGRRERGGSRRPASATQPAAANGFWPLLLLALSLSAWLGFQAYLLALDRQTLLAAHAAQQQTVDGATKLRASLDTLAADTQRLADAGNGPAKLLVGELEKRGITINPAASSGPPR